jgi:hypothetical protein
VVYSEARYQVNEETVLEVGNVGHSVNYRQPNLG